MSVSIVPIELPLADPEIDLTVRLDRDAWMVCLEAKRTALFAVAEANFPVRFTDNALTLIPGRRTTVGFRPTDPNAAPRFRTQDLYSATYVRSATAAARCTRSAPMANFSYQLYSSRKFPPLSDTLTMLAGAGYRQVEGFGGLFADPAAVSPLKRALSATGLEMPSGHFGLDMVEDAAEVVLDIAGELNINTVIVPSIPEDERPVDGEGWRALGRRLDEAGKPIRDAGLVFGYHNHAFEFQATAGGEIPMERLLEGGLSLKWEIDVAWVVRGDADPLHWIAAHADRIVAAHIKDIAPAGSNEDEDGWADVGHGTMDWPSIMAALRHTPCRYFVMEHDNPSDDRRFAERSIAAATAFDKERA